MTTAPTLDFDFAPGSLPAGLTFTRASTGWYFTTTGLLVSALTNIPRFGCGLGGTSVIGIIIENAVTNSCIQSRDLTQVAWVKLVTPTVAMDQIGVDGAANSCSSLTATAANDTCLQTITIGSAAYTFSAYVKRITGTGNILITDNGGTNTTDITSLINSSTFTRVQITRTQANPVVGFKIVTSGDAIAVDCCQLEALSFASTPIPTTTIAVARSADVLTADAGSFASFNEPEGTFYAHVRADTATTASNRCVVAADASGNSNESHAIFLDAGAGLFQATTRDGGVAQSTINLAANAANTYFKVAYAYKLNDMAACLDAGAVGTDVSGTMPTPTVIRFGQRANTLFLGGYIRRVRYYNTRIANAELQQMTGPPIITSDGGGASASINSAENQTAVTTVAATSSETLTFSISGTDSSFFAINSSSGVLTWASAPNFESRLDANADGVYLVTVTASDGLLTDTQALSVTVTNVNEAPVITSDGGGAAAAVAMTAAQTISTAVTTVTATDVDAGTTFTYSITGGADQALFTINAVSGVLSFVNPTVAGVYVVIVQVSDGALTDSQTITVTVTGILPPKGGGGALSVAMALTAKKKSRGPYWPDWLR